MAQSSSFVKHRCGHARLSAGLLRAAELLDILRGSLDDAPTEVRIGPDQLAASPW
jgi:hypothetical protein